MKIFSHTILPQKAITLNFKSNSNITSCQAKNDSFEYTTKIKPWNEKRIAQIFDETYKKVLAQHAIVNPVTKELSLPKPKIILNSLEDNTAKYRYSDNSIELDTEHAKENYYLCEGKDKKGNICPIAIFTKSQLDENLEEIKTVYSDITTTKLTDKEKETYISAILAHELRHFIQAHLMASCKGTSDELKQMHEALKKEITQLIEELKAEGEVIDMNLQQKFSHSLNYKPKKLLDENTTFKFSMFGDDNRFWSVKNNFLASELRISNPDKVDDFDLYLSSAQEVDAYNYQYEYLLTQMGGYDNNFRENVMFKICAILETDANMALDMMYKLGEKFENE